MSNDDELLQKAVDGDMRSFEDLIKQYERLIYSVCYRMFNNPEDAMDMSQEVYIKIYKNMHKIIGKGSFKSWVCTVANNACIDELRKRKMKVVSLDAPVKYGDESIQRDIEDTELLPEEKIIQTEKDEILKIAIEKLSENYKSVIILREIEDCSYDEIAEILDISLGTVKSRIARGRKKLQELYLKEMEQNGYNSVY